MTTKIELSIVERRSRLERRANVIRSRLLRTIDAIDVRRHQVVEVTHHAKRLVTPVALTVLGVAVAATAVGLGIRAFLRSRRERDLGFRIQRAVTRFRARTEPKPSLGWEVVRRLTLTLAGIAATELGKRGMKNLLDGRTLDGHLALGSARHEVDGRNGSALVVR
jgi:hypothetical protein